MCVCVFLAVVWCTRNAANVVCLIIDSSEISYLFSDLNPAERRRRRKRRRRRMGGGWHQEGAVIFAKVETERETVAKSTFSRLLKDELGSRRVYQATTNLAVTYQSCPLAASQLVVSVMESVSVEEYLPSLKCSRGLLSRRGLRYANYHTVACIINEVTHSGGATATSPLANEEPFHSFSRFQSDISSAFKYWPSFEINEFSHANIDRGGGGGARRL